MSASRWAYIYCDGDDCPMNGGEATCGESGQMTIPQYRAMLKEKDGWTHSRGKDYCESCSKKRSALPGAGEHGKG